jgi:uncharacterized membrane protein YkgB
MNSAVGLLLLFLLLSPTVVHHHHEASKVQEVQLTPEQQQAAFEAQMKFYRESGLGDLIFIVIVIFFWVLFSSRAGFLGTLMALMLSCLGMMMGYRLVLIPFAMILLYTAWRMRKYEGADSI